MSKRKKKFTVPEFKTWLEGIMQFQDSDWSPTREQWEEIYDKIMDLKEPVNKEKMSLTDATLDEINGIVYENMKEIMENMPRPQIQQPMQHPNYNPNNYHNANMTGGNNPPAPNNSAPPPPQQNDELANVSLSKLREDYERKQGAVGGGSQTHKLPDRVDTDGIPEDFV